MCYYLIEIIIVLLLLIELIISIQNGKNWQQFQFQLFLGLLACHKGEHSLIFILGTIVTLSSVHKMITRDQLYSIFLNIYIYVI